MQLQTVTRPSARMIGRRNAQPSIPGANPICVQLSGSGSANWDIRLPAQLGGTSMRTNGGLFHGVNWGAYGSHGGRNRTDPLANGTYAFPTSIAQAVAEVVSDGIQHVRLIGYGRWRGQYTNTPDADGEDDNCHTGTSETNIENLLECCRQLSVARVWWGVGAESDCGQGGAQSTGDKNFCSAFKTAGEVPMIMDDNGVWTVDPVQTNFSTYGYNYLTSPRMFNRVLRWWIRIVNEVRHLPYRYFYELLSEPLPGKQSDGTTPLYDSTWSARIKSYFRVLIREIRKLDPITPFLLGGRGAYNLDPEMGEVILTERGDCMYTWDRLDSGALNYLKGPSVLQKALSFLVPIYQNQFGIRSSADSATSSETNPGPPPVDNGCMASGYAVFKAYGVSATWWQHCDGLQNDDATVYGWRYFHVIGGVYTRTDKTPRILIGRAAMGYTVANMLAAATTAINAATSPEAFWFTQPDVNGHISNAFTDLGVTVASVGSVMEQWNQKLGATYTFIESTAAARPTLTATAVVAYMTGGDVGLVDRFPAAKFVPGALGTGTLLNGSSSFYANTDDQTIIIAGVGAASGVQAIFTCGNGTGGQTYPLIGINAGGTLHAQWTNGTLTDDCVGTTPIADIPFVVTAKKTGNNKIMYVLGCQEGLTKTSAITGTVITDLVIGGKSNGNAPTYQGTIAFVFFCKQALSDAARISIERLAAYLVGAPYLL